MKEERTLRENIRYWRNPPLSVKKMREYLENVMFSVSFLWALIAYALTISITSGDWAETILTIFVMVPMVGVATIIIATRAAEEIERVVREGEWP